MPRPKHWLSWTTSKRPARAARARRARRLKVSGSGNPAVHMSPNSSASIHVRNSAGAGMRNGSGSRYRSRLGTGTKSDPVVEHGPRLAGEDGDLMAELDQLGREVPGVDALAAGMGVAAIGQKGDAKGPAAGGPWVPAALSSSTTRSSVGRRRP